MPWGHRHDLTLLVVMLYPSWWLGRISPLRAAMGTVIGVLTLLIVIVDGSRTIWFAMSLASAVVLIPVGLKHGPTERRSPGCTRPGAGCRRRGDRGQRSPRHCSRARPECRHSRCSVGDVGAPTRGVALRARGWLRARFVRVGPPADELFRHEFVRAATPGQRHLPAPAGGRPPGRPGGHHDPRNSAAADPPRPVRSGPLGLDHVCTGRIGRQPDRFRVPRSGRNWVGRVRCSLASLPAGPTRLCPGHG